MEQEEIFRRLGIALAIGLMVGLERGWQTREVSDERRTAGLRTFALSGLLGGICGLLSNDSSPIILVAGLLVFSGALVSFSLLEARARQKFTVTSTIAGILTFVLGAYAVLGNETVAVAAAVVMAALLAMRGPLHEWVKKVTWPEMRSALVLLAMSFLLLPILPDRPVDPWEVLNPYRIWLCAILVASISFVGYIAVRIFGDRKGVTVAAIAGGVASSTATTLSLARLARDHKENSRLLSGGVLLAGTVMIVRIIVLAGVLKPDLLAILLWPTVSAGTVFLLGAVLLLRGPAGNSDTPHLQIKNPFELSVVLRLASLIALIMVLGKIAAEQSGNLGLFVLSGVSGIADVDALILSVTRLTNVHVSETNAAIAILIAAGVNTVSKATIATFIGGKQMGVIVCAVSTLAIAAVAFTWMALEHS